MKWDFAHKAGLFFIITNAVGIIVLLETILFRIPYITLFIFIFGITYIINKKLLEEKS